MPSAKHGPTRTMPKARPRLLRNPFDAALFDAHHARARSLSFPSGLFRKEQEQVRAAVRAVRGPFSSGLELGLQ